MNRYIILTISVALLLSMMTGCATRSDFTAISGKNVNISNVKLEPKMAKGRTSGKDCKYTVLFFFNKFYPTMGDALDRALDSKQANLLLDARVRWNYFFIPLLYEQECWEAEGVAYDTFNK